MKLLSILLGKERMRSPERQGELLRFTQVNADKAATGNRGVIETVSLKPFPVTSTDDIHRRIIEAGNPFRKFYIVDVVVQTVNGVPSAYKVTRLHDICDMEA